MDTPFIIAGREFRSRLFVGTGKYTSNAVMVQALEASGAEVVTVAVRRVSLRGRAQPGGPHGGPANGTERAGARASEVSRGSGQSPDILDYLDPKRYMLLPNTAGCYTADDAIRTARLGREAGLSDWVKLEVIGDQRTLFPDNEALIQATKVLASEGFIVLPYTNDDPIVCRKLEEAGAAAVMPAGAPIGSGLGIQNPNNIRIIKEFANVPVIVDAGVGTASDAVLAMELGVDGILMNTAIAGARDPVAMASAMRHAVEAGRLAFTAGRIPRKMYATASSPLEGVVGQ